ncbi:MAG: saccharopine dehydrogenase NADP-binding domain-containing protein [Candidatus Thermoplasmatota archaeon]|jgi:saccharopine dehydrogenase-like NADP-dependent oxidoreductase|nr:saccharopine dehydrogenase NADP-binding domain-containing protein [Candidatus Thermoplasmatota archaeon]
MPKSFLVIGGAGDMGSSVLEDLGSHGAGELIVGDISEKSIEGVISKLKKKGIDAKGEKVDVNNARELSKAVQKADVVVNTVGPFYRFEKKILDTIRDFDIGYVDICDDFDVTSDVFRSRTKGDKVKARIIVGMGWTPGITNVCARDGYEQMESVKEINIAWVGSAADAAGKAVIEHTFHAVTGDVPMFLNGAITSVPARQFHKEIEFPDPINKVDTYYTGHPEPITIPLFLKGVETVTVRGALVPDWQNHLVSQFADIGLTENKLVEIKGNKVSAREFLVNFVHDTLEQFKAGGVDKSAFWVEVKGRKNGKKVAIRYSGADTMKRLTGIPAAIGAKFLAENPSLKNGLYAPEGIIEPTFLFKELKKRKIVVKKFVETEEF